MPWWLVMIIVAAAAYTGLSLAAGIFLFVYAVPRRKGKADGGAASSPAWRPYAERINRGISWIRGQKGEPVHITSFDGLRLSGALYPAPGKSRGALLLMHGYRSDRYTDFSCGFRLYRELGFDVLSVDQRAHGESQGRFICYGTKERFDCRDWAEYLASRTEGPIFLCGLSMGAATVLMASGLKLPDRVRGIVADCGFTSPAEEFRWIMRRRRLRLPYRLALFFADIISRALAGFGFHDCSTLDAMAVNRLPVLFFHGGRDRFVPTAMSVQNYEACRGPKKLVIVKGASHGQSFLLETGRCTRELTEFFDKYGGAEND